MKVAIIDIIGIPYDGTTVFKQGLGGSESAVIYVGRELAKIGFDVTVFNNCDIDHAVPGDYEGVSYRPLDQLNDDHYFDIVISSRTIIPFVDPKDYGRLGDNRAYPFREYNLYDKFINKAKMKVLWMHDTFCLGDNMIEELAVQDRITDIFTLSDFHLTYVANCNHGRRRNFEVLKRKMFLTRNGVYLHRDKVDIRSKDKNLFVYNASVTKGMIPLVKKIWPQVKKHIPEAKLKVIGGYYRFSKSSEPDQQEKDWHVMANDPVNRDLDIEFTGVISQKEIADILASANFMIYPAAFPETFGISSLESLCYNTPLITCRFGALEEIAVENACYLIDYAIEPNGLFPDIKTDQQVAEFVKATVMAYRNPYLHQQKQYYCNIVKDVAGWDSVVLQWKQHFYHRTGKYLSRDEYRRVTKINHRIKEIWKRRYTNPCEIESYRPSKEQNIVVVSTFYNCEDYIERCIDSVACQDYENYQHILINDASTDRTEQVIIDKLNQLPKDISKKYHYISNKENVGAVKNQIDAFRQINDPDAIVIILDGDDSLYNKNTIFSFYNDLYHDGTEFSYGSSWSMVDNIPLISQPYPDDVKAKRSYRQHHFNWILPYTHLRTFRKYLVDGLKDDQFQDESGSWYKAGGDGSVFYSLIERADPDKVKVVQDIVYYYNDTSPTNDYKINGVEQNQNARKIVSKKYQPGYTVVIPTMWKEPDLFVPFLGKLNEIDLVDQIIVINNRPDATPASLPQGPKIQIVDFGKNIYVNPAWNLGVKLSRNDRICIANDDVVFDTNLFQHLYDQLTVEAGVFGLCPGVPDFNQIPVTTKTIDIVPWTPGNHTYGFGCLMFIHKKNYDPIPEGLDIYFGDNWIFDRQLQQGRTNYLIANLDFHSPFASTTKDTSITSGFLERERPIYEKAIKEQQLAPKKMIKPKKILIAIPTAKNIEAETFKTIYNLEVPEGYTTDFQYFYGYNIDQVRNLIADWVVKGYDYLFSVDSDIGLPADALKRLLSHDKDVVSGLYIQRKPGKHILEIYEDNGRGGVSNMDYGKLKGRNLVEIAGCGFGCVLVKAEVMRKIGYPQFKYYSAINHANTISEDVDFCRKARTAGFKIWADPNIRCRHIGSTEFVINENIPVITDEQDISKRLQELHDQELLPKAHVDYLQKISHDIKPKVIYDIGSCVLHWTNQAKKAWPDAKYVLFEAMSSCEFLYKKQGFDYNIGLLSDTDGKQLDFYQNEYHPGGNSYYKENEKVNPQAPMFFNESHIRKMTSYSLDSIVKQRGFPLPDLVKMDVQGAELDVLKGATETLKNVNDVILELQSVEYNTNAPLKDKVISYMESLGFQCLGMFCNNGPDGDYHFRRL